MSRYTLGESTGLWQLPKVSSASNDNTTYMDMTSVKETVMGVVSVPIVICWLVRSYDNS